jgi:hypothetical protein
MGRGTAIVPGVADPRRLCEQTHGRDCRIGDGHIDELTPRWLLSRLRHAKRAALFGVGIGLDA